MFLNRKNEIRLQLPFSTIAALLFINLLTACGSFYLASQLSHAAQYLPLSLFIATLFFMLLISICIIFAQTSRAAQVQQQKLRQALFSAQKDVIEVKTQFEFSLNHDSATKLPNKKAVEKRLNKLINAELNCALFSIAINNIHFISDSYGNLLVEELLGQLAERVKHILDEDKLLARAEFDKMLLICPGMSALNAEILANQLHNLLKEEFIIDEYEIVLQTAIGITYYQEQNVTSNLLIHQANLALRYAKTLNQPKIARYYPSMQKELDKGKNVELALKHAIHHDELTLYYQPQLDLRSGDIVGVEVLIRWLDSQGNSVMSPSAMIKVAEKSGLMPALGHWIMEAALKQYAKLLDDRCAPGVITINASGLEFANGDFAEHVNRILTHYDIPASRVQIELSEQVFANNIESLVVALQRLARLGVSLAINDFGTGYLSLYYLKQLPIHTLKIDRSFIGNLAHSKDDMIICQTIITMANLLQMRVISVGIEDEQQQAMLQNIGCHYAQGEHLFSPLSFAKITNVLKSQRERKALTSLTADINSP